MKKSHWMINNSYSSYFYPLKVTYPAYEFKLYLYYLKTALFFLVAVTVRILFPNHANHVMLLLL